MNFVITEIVCIPISTSSSLRKKKTGKESQYIASRPELGSDLPFGSDQESGCDKLVSEPRFRRLWMSLRLRRYLHSNVLA